MYGDSRVIVTFSKQQYINKVKSFEKDFPHRECVCVSERERERERERENKYTQKLFIVTSAKLGIATSTL